jgi:FkbM family methyltransferase
VFSEHSTRQLRLQPSTAAAFCASLPFGGPFAFALYNKIEKRLRRFRTMETVFGARMTCDARDYIQYRILHFGLWEPNITQLFLNHVQKGETVVDIGANVGYYSLLASQLTGDSGTVVSIEASPTIAARLRHNLNQNDCRNVRVANVAVSDRPGMASIYDGPVANTGMTTTVARPGWTVSGQIDALPLDEILSDDELKRVTFIKIDVEGAERPVLQRILDRLDRYPRLSHLVVEAMVHEAPDAWHALFARMRRNGFSASAVQNQQEFGIYMHWNGPEPLAPLDRLPETQLDIFFERTGVSL